MRYKHLVPSEEDIKKSIRLQYLAVHAPRRITIPEGFVPETSLDKRILWLIHRNEKGSHDGDEDRLCG